LPDNDFKFAWKKLNLKSCDFKFESHDSNIIIHIFHSSSSRKNGNN
jgi:hypothetical protein